MKIATIIYAGHNEKTAYKPITAIIELQDEDFEALEYAYCMLGFGGKLEEQTFKARRLISIVENIIHDIAKLSGFETNKKQTPIMREVKEIVFKKVTFDEVDE